MGKQSAGLMMYRQQGTEVEVFLVHPGGPYWAGKDKGAWGVPKGEYAPGENALAAAQREFHEETGFDASEPFVALGAVKLASAKVISAWAFRGDCDPALLRSNTCEIEWPPRSGRRLKIAEVDRGAWFTLSDAAGYIADAQRPFLERLGQALDAADES